MRTLVIVVALAGCGGGSGGGLPVGDAEVDGTVDGMSIENAKAAFYAKAETPDSGVVLIGPAFSACGAVEDEGYHLIVGMPCPIATGTMLSVGEIGQSCPYAWMLVEQGPRDVLGGRTGEVEIEAFGETVQGRFSAMMADTDEQLSMLEGRFNAIRCIDERIGGGS